jgi:23S rRNA pseudouridine2457 synthase
MNATGHRYFILHKPYNMVSQFISPDEVNVLGDLHFKFPEGTHAIGRLDNHSEGLLILTTNKKVTRLLFQGEVPHKRTYLVKVQYKVEEEALQRLRSGITMLGRKGVTFTTLPCEVEIVPKPTCLSLGHTEQTEYIAYTWLRMTLTEGKYHQIRKMVAAVRHRCVRLIRVSIEDLELGDLLPGHVREIEETEFFERLKIDNWK